MDEYTADEDRARKERSPSFPFIPLDRAIERAAAMATAHRKSPARLATVADTWGYSPSSSGLQQTAAALKAFGLLEDTGRGVDRRVVLSSLAWRILTDTRPGAKEQAIREAALRPRLLAEYADSWLLDRPNDNHRLSELQLDRGFTPGAAKLFIKTFDDTMSFANLPDADNLSPSSILSESGDFAMDVQERGPTGPNMSRMLTIAGPGPNGPASPSGSRVAQADSMLGRFAGGQPDSSPRATLPLPEGMVALEIPARLSRRSHDALKAWVNLMVQLAEGAIANDVESDKDA